MSARLYPELRGKDESHILNQQLFFIAMTMKGMGWNDLNNLNDSDRHWLVNKCSEYWEEYEKEMSKTK